MSYFSKNIQVFDIIDGLVDNHGRLTIGFDELKNTWTAFDLGQVETDVLKKLMDEPIDSFDGHWSEMHSIKKYYSRPPTRKYPPSKANPHVNFHCVYETGGYLNHYPITWFAFGPRELENQENFRFLEEFERATTEQRQQMLIDGFMTSLDDKYFWCARLITWVEENCQYFEGDIENMAVEFIHFYAKEDAYDWVGDNCGFHLFAAIQLLCDAIDLKLSDDDVQTLDGLLSVHFHSHVMAGRENIENYMAATQWARVKRRMDAEYGNSTNIAHRGKYSTKELAENAQRFESSDRYKAIVDEHATRTAKRALRRIDQLEELIDVISNDIFLQSMDIAVESISGAISRMSENNAINHKQKLNSLTDTKNGLWAKHLNESILRYSLQST